MNKGLTLSVDISLDDLVESAQHTNNADLIEFIKVLDDRVGEWDFTLALCEYFAQKKSEYEAEVVE